VQCTQRMCPPSAGVIDEKWGRTSTRGQRRGGEKEDSGISPQGGCDSGERGWGDGGGGGWGSPARGAGGVHDGELHGAGMGQPRAGSGAGDTPLAVEAGVEDPGCFWLLLSTGGGRFF